MLNGLFNVGLGGYKNDLMRQGQAIRQSITAEELQSMECDPDTMTHYRLNKYIKRSFKDELQSDVDAWLKGVEI